MWYGMENHLGKLRMEGFLSGLTFSAMIIWMYFRSQSKAKKLICDDQSNSLFYGKQIGEKGCGFPTTGTIDSSVVEQLTIVHPEYKRLAMDLYKSAVESLPIVCVDVICRNMKDKKLLLFFRKDKPASSIWWWPGGRLVKGETFFVAATRKIREETGNPNANVVPIGIVNVWNTFFPDSSWDDGRAPGREGTQTVNITVFCELRGDEIIVKQGTNSEWAVESARWIFKEEALEVGKYDKYVRLNVEQAIALGYL